MGLAEKMRARIDEIDQEVLYQIAPRVERAAKQATKDIREDSIKAWFNGAHSESTIETNRYPTTLSIGTKQLTCSVRSYNEEDAFVPDIWAEALPRWNATHGHAVSEYQWIMHCFFDLGEVALPAESFLPMKRIKIKEHPMSNRSAKKQRWVNYGWAKTHRSQTLGDAINGFSGWGEWESLFHKYF